MKSIIMSLAVILALRLWSHSHAQIPPVAEEFHKNVGGQAEWIAASIGSTEDTVFISTGVRVEAFSVDHATPDPPTALGGISFGTSGYVRCLYAPAFASLILAGQKNGLLIKDYLGSDNFILNGNEIRAITGDDNGDTVFVAFSGSSGNGFKIFDITNPATPVILSSEDTLSININDLEFHSDGLSDTLFMAGDNESPVRIYNITNPAAITQIASQSGTSNNYNGIAVSGDSVYVSDSGYGYYSFARFAAGPGTMTPVGGQNIGSAEKIIMINDTILTSSNDGVRAWNAMTGQLLGGPVAKDGSGAMQIAVGTGNTFYGSFYQHGLQILDGPSSLAIVGNGAATGDYVYDIASHKNHIFVSNGFSGIRIYDASSYIEVGGSPFLWTANGKYVYLAFKKDFLFAISPGNDFDIVDVSNPAAPVYKNNYSTGLNGIRKVFVSDSILAIADNDGIKLLDIKDVNNISQIGGTITLPDGCSDVKIIDQYLYAVPGYGNIAIWDISDPAAPVFQDSTTGVQPGGKFDTDGDVGYYTQNDSVYMFDVSTPATIGALNGLYNYPGTHAESIKESGDFLHLGLNDGTIRIIDISDTTNIIKVDSFTVVDYCSRLTIHGLNLYVSANSDGWYHLSDPYGKARVLIHGATALPQDTVSLNVYLDDNVSQLGALSFEMYFTYDTSYLSFVNLSRGTGLPSTDSLISNVILPNVIADPGTLLVARADTGGIAGLDTLLKLHFRVNDNAQVEPLLQSTPVDFSHLVFSEGFPGAIGLKGIINIIPRFGDANSNGIVTSADASTILQYMVRIIPTPPPLILADVSYNGDIRAFDAALILKRMVIPGYRFPVEDFFNLPKGRPGLKDDNARILVSSEPVKTENTETNGNSGQSVLYSISVKDAPDIWSAELIVDFGPGQKYIGYQIPPNLDHFMVQHHEEGGRLYISMARYYAGNS